MFLLIDIGLENDTKMKWKAYILNSHPMRNVTLENKTSLKGKFFEIEVFNLFL